jgi:hypothetical protein
MKIAGLGTLVLFTAAAAPAADKLPNCFKDSFEGHCVAADVNGQKTVRLTKKTKKLLKEFNEQGSRPFGNCSAHYEVPSPVRGGLDLRFGWLPEAVGYFGPGAEALVHVYPLEGQSLDTRTEISTASSVRAGGSAVVTQADVIEGNRLPPGRYVLTARVSGSKRGWDCHGFVVQVAE